MIQERTIARIFAAVLLIGMFCVAYVLLTQPTAMITYELQEEPQKEKMPEKEMLKTFEQEWNQIKDELVMLGNQEKK
jgi:hypothetical protein